jgi:hypothetical protein
MKLRLNSKVMALLDSSEYMRIQTKQFCHLSIAIIVHTQHVVVYSQSVSDNHVMLLTSLLKDLIPNPTSKPKISNLNTLKQHQSSTLNMKTIKS